MSLCDLTLRAHLEGSENASSFLSQLNGDYLMANWYKIVLAVVFVVCATGLIVGNIRYFVKKRKNKVK